MVVNERLPATAPHYVVMPVKSLGRRMTYGPARSLHYQHGIPVLGLMQFRLAFVTQRVGPPPRTTRHPDARAGAGLATSDAYSSIVGSGGCSRRRRTRRVSAATISIRQPEG